MSEGINLWFILIVAVLLLICLAWMAIQVFFKPTDYLQLTPQTPKALQQTGVDAEQSVAAKKQIEPGASAIVFFPVQPASPATQTQGKQVKPAKQRPRFSGRALVHYSNIPCWICGCPKVQCPGH